MNAAAIRCQHHRELQGDNINRTSFTRYNHRFLVVEEVPERLHAGGACSLSPCPPRRMERRIAQNRSDTLVLGAQPKRLVPSAVRRAQSGHIRVELQNRRDVLLEVRRGIAERLVIYEKELDGFFFRRDRLGAEVGTWNNE